MHLTTEQLVAEFQDAVMELYFARKRIALLEEENAALTARLEQAQEQAQARPQAQERAQAASSGEEAPTAAG
jgi:hypothetical protein